MTYRGHVKEGVVVLDEAAQLPEGAQVRIDIVEKPDTNAPGEDIPSLYDRLAPVIGKAKGLPPDLARNHDHYLHGRPKK